MTSDHPNFALTSGDLEDLAVFPLPDGILFPHTTIRLHIFEPRYRRLVEDALDADAPIAVAMIAANGRSDPHGRPYLHPVAGAGAIISSQRLAGGRFNILVRGVGRVRILDDLDVSTPYRRIRAASLPDQIADMRKADVLLKTIQNCLFSVRTNNSEVVEFLLEAFTVADSHGAAADMLAAVVFGDSLARQRALSEPDVCCRLEAILERLVDLVAVPDDGPAAPSALVN